jgi:hypothetical protein
MKADGGEAGLEQRAGRAPQRKTSRRDAALPHADGM